MKKSKILVIAILVWLAIVMFFSARNVFLEDSNFFKIDTVAATETNNTGKGLIIVADDLVKESTNATTIKNNSANLQKHIDTVSNAGGGVVRIPSGIYYFASSGPNSRNMEEYVILCKDNVIVEGEGTSESSGTILIPYGTVSLSSGGIDMFYYNQYADSGFTDPDFLENADFRNFTIDGKEVISTDYNSSGKGFMINLFKNCDWENVIVRNTEGTGFGMDCPINSTVKNCKAINCGRAVEEESDPGGSGFGIGTGYSDDESIHIINCTATDNGKFGFFFEHQAKFSNANRYGASKSNGFVVSNCTAQNNMYDFGGLRANDVTYENCASTSTDDNSTKNLSPILFKEHSKRTHVTNFKSSRIFSDVTDVSKYYYEPTYWAVENAISVGTSETEFSPKAEASKSQVITFLWRMAERPGDVDYEKESVVATKYDGLYDDVEGTASYAEAIKWAKEKNIIDSSSSTFEPDAGCTRAMFVTYLWKYAGSPSATTSYSFTDIPSGADYQNAVNWAVSKGITTGKTDTTFAPDDICARSEIVTFLYRYFNGKNNFNVTYNLNGGTLATSNPSTYKSGTTTFTLNNPSKIGYTFEGWTGSNGSTPQKTVKVSTSDVGNKVYTANWTANNYTVTFDSNGGTGEMIAESFTYDVPQLLSENSYVKTGYNFTGWSTTTKNARSVYENEAAIYNLTSTADENITLYAQWSAQNVNYTVNHYKQETDGTYPTVATETETLTAIADASITPEVKSYTGFKSPFTQTATVNADGSTTINYYYERNLFTVTITKGEGIKNVTGAGSYRYGEKVPLTFELDPGYKSWEWKLTGIGEEDYDDATDTFIMPNNNVSIDVYITELFTYAITYNLNGGTETTNPTEYNVKSATITLNSPTKDGYEFLGWKGSNGSEPQKNVTIPTGTTGSKNYTANWKSETANTYSYKVEHYKQNIDESYPSTPSETETIEATNLEVTPNRKTYIGFKTPSSQTVTINADGTTVVKYYYERESYTVSITKGKGIKTATGAGTYKYGETVYLIFEAEAGYKAWAWSMSGIGDDDYNKDTDSFAMPNNNVSINVYVTELFTYTITYNLNGGTGNANPSTYNVESSEITLAEPTKEGYEFLGWTGSNGTEPQKNVTISAGSTGNKSYTANWKEINPTTYTYVVEHYKQGLDGNYSTIPDETESFETTSSSVIPSTKTYEGFTSPERQTITLSKDNAVTIKYYYVRNSYTITVTTGKGIKSVTGAGTYKYGESVNIVIELAAGYNGYGNYMTGITKEYYNDGSFNMPATDITFDIAANSTYTYTITYNLNGGIISGAQTTFNVETEDFTLPKPTKEEYEFLGWTGSNGDTPQKEVTIKVGTTGNLEYTANWKQITPNTYTYIVEHYKQGLDGNYIADPDEVETFTTTETSVTPNTKTYEGFISPEKETVTLDANKTTVITYLYERSSYTININTGKGIKSVTGAGTYKYGQSVNIIIEFEVGYNGYEIIMTGITKEYYNNGSFNMPATNITLDIVANSTYTYTITYNLNGGTIIGEKTSFNVETEDFTLPKPTKEGYEFLGWTGSNGDTPQKEVTIKAGTTGNLEYTANWKSTSVTYSYKVEHYKQNIDGSYSNIPDEIEEFEIVSSDTQTTPNTKQYEGFTSPEQQTVTLDENKTTVIKYLYERNSYKIEIEKGSGIAEITGNGTYKYGQEVSIIIVTTEGYENITYTINGIEQENLNGKFNMPANNITGNVSASLSTYTITYNLEGGNETSNPTTYTVESDDIVLKEPTKEGSEFLGWIGSNGNTPQKEVTISEGSVGNREYTAVWKNKIIKYTVEHYKQNKYGNYLNIPDEKEEFEAEYGTTVEPNTKYYNGFISPEKQKITIKENSTIKYYYSRSSYEVKIKTKAGIDKIISNDKYLYEERVVLQAVQAEGYDIVTWKIINNGEITYYVGPVLYFDMPANEVTIEVEAEKDMSNLFGNDQPVYLSCKIEHYLQNLDGTYPEIPIESEIQTTIIGSSVNAKTKTYEGFTAPKTEILRSGVIKYYYTRNSYTLNIIKRTGIKDAPEGKTYKYNEEISLNATLMDGYENIKWVVKTDKEEQQVQDSGIKFNMPASDVNIEIIATPITYTITYDLQEGKEDTNPKTYTIESEEIKLTNPTKEGYEFLGWTGSNGNTPQKDVIIPEGSTGDKEYIANWKLIEDVTNPDEDDKNKDDGTGEENKDNNDKEENPDKDVNDGNSNNNNDDDNDNNDNNNNNNNNNEDTNKDNNENKDDNNDVDKDDTSNNEENKNNQEDNNIANSEENNNNSNGGTTNNGNNAQSDTEKNEQTTNNDKVVIENENLSNTKETKTNSSTKENTTEDDLPKAGKEVGLIISLIVIAASFGIISLRKYLKYKDI